MQAIMSVELVLDWR